MSKAIYHNYTELQDNMDKVVGKIGLDRTVELLENLLSDRRIHKSDPAKIKMMMQFIIDIAIQTYNLDERFFYTSMIREYRDARMSCLHLLRKYSGESYPKIGLHFQSSERTVRYGCERVKERLDFPKGNTAFVKAYLAMEAELIEFISKLN